MFSRILILLTLTVSAAFAQDCGFFASKINDAKLLEQSRFDKEKTLEETGFFQTDDEIGYARTQIVPCRCNDTRRWYDDSNADLITIAARLVADEDLDAISSFNQYLSCYTSTIKSEPKTSRPKYRSCSGYGNNLKNPYWGTTGAPFTRFGPKNYADAVFKPRKSVGGNYLPSARRLVLNVLQKADIKSRTSKIPNDMFTYAGLFIAQDIGASVDEKLHKDKCKDIRCCTNGNRKALHCAFSQFACFPIEIGADDPYYKDHKVRCLNFIRSDKSALPGTLQYGEIMNKATSYVDLSLVYGNENSHTDAVRTFSGGKLRVNSKNLLAVDSSGEYSPISDRMRGIPLTAVWPTLYTRNHNKIAEALAVIYPSWGDKKLYDESRRINIAVLQSHTLDYVNFLFESTGGLPLNLPYNETVDILSNVEFHSAAYRYFHFYINSDVLLLQNDGTSSKIKLSDTFGKMPVAEDNFDALVNGFYAQSVNLGAYSDELVNHFAKREDGVGVDVISFDIQRGRDHGLPNYLQARAVCGLKSDFESIDDLIEIFPQSYINLLKSEYDSVEDIDLLIGGSLESFLVLDKDLVGETFDCIIRDQFRRVVAGDAYFFTHSTSPYPFTAAQIEAIRNFKFNNLVCVNSGVQSVPRSTYYVPNDSENPKDLCSELAPLNMDAFKNLK